MAHPDLGGEDGAQDSAALNDARATLADPERRANALLALLGGPTKEEDNALPDGFLMDMMEVREELEAAHASSDAGETARLGAWADEQRADYIARVSGLFGQLGATPSRDELGAIRRQLNAWRYIERMLEQIDPDAGDVM
jgi:DnaJ-domain-containing protein 1